MAYCVRCKEKVEIANAVEFTMRRGRPARKGTCATCGTGVYEILSVKEPGVATVIDVASIVDSEGREALAVSAYVTEAVEDLPNQWLLSHQRLSHTRMALCELESLIMSDETTEAELQRFLQENPAILVGRHFQCAIPQARIELSTSKPDWRADFILIPHDDYASPEIVEIKTPKLKTTRKARAGHGSFASGLNLAISQLRDYGGAFDRPETTAAFEADYGVRVVKPRLRLLAGRNWLGCTDEVRVLRSASGIEIETWEQALARFSRELLSPPYS